MRRRFTSVICKMVLALSLIAPVQNICSAQEYNNTPVTLSKEKVKIGGKVCYSHIVLEKQTLYSISKAYGVSLEDIYKYNPSVKENGLKKNAIILIPVQEEMKEMAQVKPVKTENSPEKVEVVKANKPKAEKTRTHVRKWYEDLDMIAELYGVSVEAIMVANNLTDTKLSNRQKLVIPSSDMKYDAGTSRLPEQNTTASLEQSVENQSETTDSTGLWSEVAQLQNQNLYTQNDVNATVLLPMRNAGGKLSRNNMDFYSGIMLAVYDLSKEGVNIDINTYDIADTSTPVTKEDIEDSDLIIGPITTADLTRLFQSTSDAGAVISPLDPRAECLTETYSNMIQVPTPHKAQYQDLVNWITEDMGENDKVFMFSERVARNNDAVNSMKEVMDSSGLQYTPFAYSILEGRDIIEPLKEMMTPEGVNRIYIASESEAFVNDVVRNLNLMLLENFSIVLYAPSKIRSFETIEVEHFHKTSMHVSLTYYINYDDKAVKDFLLKYRALYNTEPTQFAFQGYDIARYFISLCHKYGKAWPEKLEENEKAMLQSTFKCMKLGTGGYVNNGVRRIVYGPGWSVTQVK